MSPMIESSLDMSSGKTASGRSRTTAANTPAHSAGSPGPPKRASLGPRSGSASATGEAGERHRIANSRSSRSSRPPLPAMRRRSGRCVSSPARCLPERLRAQRAGPGPRTSNCLVGQDRLELSVKESREQERFRALIAHEGHFDSRLRRVASAFLVAVRRGAPEAVETGALEIVDLALAGRGRSGGVRSGRARSRPRRQARDRRGGRRRHRGHWGARRAVGSADRVVA